MIQEQPRWQQHPLADQHECAGSEAIAKEFEYLHAGVIIQTFKSSQTQNQKLPEYIHHQKKFFIYPSALTQPSLVLLQGLHPFFSRWCTACKSQESCPT